MEVERDRHHTVKVTTATTVDWYVTLTGLSSLLFLGGGVATYFVPSLTPPLYIAGSMAMLINVIVSRARQRRSRRDPWAKRGVIPHLATGAGFVLVAFLAGFFF